MKQCALWAPLHCYHGVAMVISQEDVFLRWWIYYYFHSSILNHLFDSFFFTKSVVNVFLRKKNKIVTFYFYVHQYLLFIWTGQFFVVSLLLILVNLKICEFYGTILFFYGDIANRNSTKPTKIKKDFNENKFDWNCCNSNQTILILFIRSHYLHKINVLSYKNLRL